MGPSRLFQPELSWLADPAAAEQSAPSGCRSPASDSQSEISSRSLNATLAGKWGHNKCNTL